MHTIVYTLQALQDGEIIINYYAIILVKNKYFKYIIYFENCYT